MDLARQDSARQDSTRPSPSPLARATRLTAGRHCAALAAASSPPSAASREFILNNQCLSIGNLIAGGELGERAIEALIAAAERMTAYRDPWRGLDRKVRNAVAAGRRRPRASG